MVGRTKQPAPYVIAAVPRNADKPSVAPTNVPKSHKTFATTSDGTEATSTISCHNCRGRGHIWRDCPRPRRSMKCSGCGSDQHRRSGCPAPTVGKSNNGESGEAYQVNAAHVVVRSVGYPVFVKGLTIQSWLQSVAEYRLWALFVYCVLSVYAFNKTVLISTIRLSSPKPFSNIFRSGIIDP